MFNFCFLSLIVFTNCLLFLCMRDSLCFRLDHFYFGFLLWRLFELVSLSWLFLLFGILNNGLMIILLFIIRLIDLYVELVSVFASWLRVFALILIFWRSFCFYFFRQWRWSCIFNWFQFLIGTLFALLTLSLIILLMLINSFFQILL